MDLNSELHGYYYEDLTVGQSAALAKTITDADVVIFAGISMDTNPMHVNEPFAANTMFKGRIAHGMLGASLLSAVFGTKLPGAGCIYVSQTLKFKAPVRIGDTMVARVTVRKMTEKKSNGFVEFDTVVTVGDTVVIDGEAMMLVPKRAG
ncbi:MAG: MaoC family dehydratase [Rhodospirillales bacterium]|jgi:3-hydroxybutyryl-CoA dehydratase|nr:MaoC family dehydratase [Rhodospirillales bacterium]